MYQKLGCPVGVAGLTGLLLLAGCQNAPPELVQALEAPKKWVEPGPETAPALMGSESDTRQADLNLEYARQQFLLKNYPVAAYYLKKTLLQQPDAPEALQLLPWAHFFQKRYELALIDFSNAHAHFPKDPDPLIGLGWCYFAMQFYERALDAFNRAAQLAPGAYEVAKGRGLTYLWMDKPEAAQQELDRIFLEDERNAVLDQWRQWKAAGRELRPDMIPTAPEAVSVFTLPPERPRFPSLLAPLRQPAGAPALNNAWRLYRKRSFARALEAFEDLPGSLEDTLDAQNGLAWSALATGDISRAREIFQGLQTQYPTFEGVVSGIRAVEDALEAKAAVAHYYFDLKKYRIARQKFEEIESDYPYWSHAPAMLGFVALAQGDEEEAVSYFHDALELDAKEPAALEGMNRLQEKSVGILFKAEHARISGDPKTASYLYWDYIQNRKPEDDEKHLQRAYLGLAWSQMEKRQYDLALDNFERLSMMETDPEELARGRGLAYYGAGDFDQATRWLTRAEELGSRQETVTEALDWSVLQSTGPREAEIFFLDRLRRRPRQASTYMALGWVYYQGGNPDLGVEYFLKSISLKPDLALTQEFVDLLKRERFGWQIYNRMAWEYYHREEYDTARRLFQAALVREPANSTAMEGLGYAYLRLGNQNLAERFLRASLKENQHPLPVEEVLTGQDTPSPVAIKTSGRTKLARLLLEQNRLKEALHLFLEARKEHPDWPEINDGLGWVYLKLGRLAESRAAFNKAIEYQPLHPEAHRGLREVRHQQAIRPL